MKLVEGILQFTEIVRRNVRRFDLFSQNVMFTYKGESSFSTFLGGLVSLVIMSVITIYSGYLLKEMVNRQNSNNYISSEVVDLSVNNKNYYPADFIIYNFIQCNY